MHVIRFKYYDKTLLNIYIPLVFMDINEVVTKLTDVDQWFSLGIQLSVPIADLKKIDVDYTGLDRKKAEMLFKWQRLGKGVSWQSLIRALNGIDEIGLARTLASQLGKQSVSQSLTCSCIRALKSLTVINSLRLQAITLYNH